MRNDSAGWFSADLYVEFRYYKPNGTRDRQRTSETSEVSVSEGEQSYVQGLIRRLSLDFDRGDWTVECRLYWNDSGDHRPQHHTTRGGRPSHATFEVRRDSPPDFSFSHRLAERGITLQDVARGTNIDLHVSIRNVGGSGDHGGITVSFPDLDQINSGSSGFFDYTSSKADVSFGYNGDGYLRSSVALNDRGDSISRKSGGRMNAKHLMVEVDQSEWRNGEHGTLWFSVKPKETGTFRIYIRGWICANGYEDCNWEPSSSSTTDQQGHNVLVEEVTVTELLP